MTKKNTSGPEPMDADAPERAVAAPTANRQRECYAMMTLRSEVETLFPETSISFGDPDGWGVKHEIIFDMSMLDEAEFKSASLLLSMSLLDDRVVAFAKDEEEQSMAVEFVTDRRYRDSRETFGLDDAWLILTGGASQ